MPESRDRAVVLGASMGGLLAARVLADFFRVVTVVERDVLPHAPMNRRGVPQDRHPHVLLGKGVQIVGELFPGFFDQLVTDGAVKWDDGDLSRFWSTFGGHLMVRSATVPDPTSLVDYHVSRPLLEFSVRKAVRAIPNVEFLEGHDVVGLTADTDANRITGARLARQGDDGETLLTTDLIIDATGRGSRAPVFLEEFGYVRPPVEELEMRIAYATMPVRVPPGMLRELVLTVNPVASRPTTFAMFAVENDTYLVLGGTLGGQQPPSDRAELLEFIAEFAPRHALDAIRAGEPLGDVVHHRIPSNRWRRYDQLARTPDGLLVLGDAVCSFNPIYGQGMTVAAAEAEVLGKCLSVGDLDLPRRFFGESAKTIQVAWRTAVGSDLALPQVEGRRPLSTRIINTYMDAVLTATETDPAVAQQFFRVAWMLDAPVRLFRPSILLRIAKALITGARNGEQVEHLRQLARLQR
ncbi:NAD(P)/FAD-dependent oxidoreductase [Mycobacterium sp. AZCC_0083]|uniref:FAD-dependent oxidoreductase n=1 Tax=Mycobacterium sp. AZCC_0083 TaxID=2735882 RepID=UPI0016225060|nr:2-polyprenyl-6-methoxyphenol hydroxylase-like oxidoreductase [Mycobacterium sp. AZCC_0083]MBB5168205.1 2-polyprenyl-6-methoxyphenol hydroxylase-like FAD-dependent oxidoreductase [Mycobacterium sp. AZCC_0083]